MLGVVACIALNIWLFRVHLVLGLIAVNITKHVVIAWLCHVVGVDRKEPARVTPASSVPAPSIPIR